MKRVLKLIGIIALVAIIGFSMACGGDNDNDNTQLNSWNVWKTDDSTATLVYSISDDGICFVNIGGTAEVNYWDAWKISASSGNYTGNKGKRYKYKFEAWTRSGTRNLRIEYYTDNPTPQYISTSVPITETRTTYTVEGEVLPKSIKQPVHFQLADQLGIVNIKMLDIKEY